MVPKGWSRSTLGEVATFKNGLNFNKADSGESIKIVGVGDFKNLSELRNTESLEFIQVEKRVSDEELLKSGDLLFVRSNGNKELIGRCLFFPNVSERLSYSGFTIRGRVNTQKILPEYASNLMRAKHITQQIFQYGGGTNISNLSQQILSDLVFSLPPLIEQEKITGILSTWEKAITTTEQLLANSQQQKKALMQKLLTGKVRFLKNVANKFEVRKGYSKSRLGPLPSDWSVETIKKNLWFQEGPGVRNFQFTESGVKLFNGTNIQFNNISLSKTTTYISEEVAFGAYKHFLVDAGDLLIACSGISVDRFDEKIAFVGEEHLPLCMNTSTMRFKAIDSNVVDIRYFQYFMQSNLFKNQIRRQATGSAQLNFGPSHVAKCFVVLPSFQEQQKIASLLSLVDFEIRAIQKKLDLLKDEKSALMQQLLTGKRRVKIGRNI